MKGKKYLEQKKYKKQKNEIKIQKLATEKVSEIQIMYLHYNIK